MSSDAIRMELEAELSRVIASEEALDRELAHSFASISGGKSMPKGLSYESTDIGHNLLKVEQFSPCFEAMVQDSQKLVGQIDECQSLSDRLSIIVRRLDMIQLRAQEALACVEDVINLKECKVGIQLALENGDIPQAVDYIRKVHHIDEQAARASDDYAAIQQAEKEVCALVRGEFQQAIEKSDIEEVLNLCPLLQTVGLENEARDTFIEFMEKSVFIGVSADAAPLDNTTDHATAYAQTLSSVFNTTCMIFQQYLPVVIQGMEKSEGDVVFIRRLHAKCEKECEVVLKRYMAFRKVKSLMSSINKQPSSSGGVTPERSGNAQAPLSPAEMHSLLDEIALLLQYCGSYSKYLRLLCEGAERRERVDSTTKLPPASGFARARSLSSTSDTGSVHRVSVFRGPTDFDRMKDELINKYYIEGEHWLIQWGIKTAMTGGESDLDGCFFVLQKCSQRAIATSNIQAACATLHLISDHLSTDLLQHFTDTLMSAVSRLSVRITDTMSKFLRSSAWYSGSDSSGANHSRGLSQGLQTALSLAANLSRTDGRESTTSSPSPSAEDMWGVSLYMEVLNRVELCVRYTESLRKEIISAGTAVYEDQESQKQPVDKHKILSDAMAKLQLCFDDFDNTKESFAQALRHAAGNLATQSGSVMKDVISSILSKSGPAGGVRFDLEDEAFDAQQMVQMLPKLLISPFEVLISMCTDSLSESNRDMVAGMLADAYCSRIEYFISQTSFSYAGALKLDECVRALNGVFSQASSVSIRSKFSRLRDIMIVLTADTTSLSGNTGSAGIGLALTQYHNVSYITEAEAHAFISLRTDFKE